MKSIHGFNYPPFVRGIKAGKIAVIPTDTLLGVVGLALNKKTIQKIYVLRGRNRKKPMIVLISSLNDLKHFGIKLNLFQKRLIKKVWPDKVSIIFPCKSKNLKYLHRGTRTIAFRLPLKKSLRILIRKTGPLVAPSANPQGKPVAGNINEAWDYFGDSIDFYVKGKIKKSLPSTIISLKNNFIKIIRPGAVDVSNYL